MSAILVNVSRIDGGLNFTIALSIVPDQHHFCRQKLPDSEYAMQIFLQEKNWFLGKYEYRMYAVIILF